MCSTRGGSQGMYIILVFTMRIWQPTLDLKPKRRHERKSKTGASEPNIEHVKVPAKTIWKNEIKHFILKEVFLTV